MRYKIIAVSLGISKAVARIGCAAVRKRSTPQAATIHSAIRYVLFDLVPD
jgi:hypothetical protein